MKSSETEKIKKEKEDNFDTWSIDIHSYTTSRFDEFCGFETYKNTYKSYLTMMCPKHIWFKYQLFNQPFIVYNIWTNCFLQIM
jgi:hypothetical protein